MTLLVALEGEPVPWSASALALSMALLSRFTRDEALAAGALALGAAPLWVHTALQGPIWGALLGGGALGLLYLARPALPSALPLGLLGVGGVLAVRQLAASYALEAAAGQALGLALAGLVLAGVTAGARREASCSGPLGVVGALGLLVSALSLRGPVQDADGVERLAARGTLRWQLDALAERPTLGLHALGLDPGFHALALRLWPAVGPGALLDAGWWPERAPLSPERRLILAERLDARGQGGRALRLLRAGRSDPEVRWQHELLARRLGSGGEWSGPAPEGVPALPGELPLSWGYFTDGARALDLHASAPLDGLSLELVGTPCEGAPAVWVGVDARPPAHLEVPARPAWVSLDLPLAAGPHRLTVRFDEDRQAGSCDRNVWVMGLRGG